MMVCAAGQRRMGLPAYEALAQAGVLATRRRSARRPSMPRPCGYLPGEGVGRVAPEAIGRRASATAIPIRAIIRGIGIAHAPRGGEALRVAIERSLAAIGAVAADIVHACESDGTACRGEDSEEVRAIAAAYCGRRPPAAAAGGFRGRPDRPHGGRLGHGFALEGRSGNRTWRIDRHVTCAIPCR